MWTTFVFDVEDYITPAEVGLDDLLKMLADVMAEQGVSGSFFIIGEKLRCLRDRGRRDVIEAIARHDLGSHVNMGSMHATLTERMEKSDWADGCARMAADELAGIDEMAEIAGREITCLARHGGSFAPQLLAMLASRKLPYVYSPAKLPKHNITWYCNTLNFGHAFAVFQEAYHSREAFLKAEKSFLDLVAEHEDCDWMAMFNSHPCHIKMREFGDANYFDGKNPPPGEWRIPPIYEEFSMERVRENWAFHCERVKKDRNLQLATIAELAKLFAAQAESADRAEIQALAEQAAEVKAPFLTERFSAAEILDILARAYLHWRKEGSLPEKLERRDVFGPAQIPLSVPTAERLHPEALVRVARGIVTSIDVTGRLPSRIRCAEGTPGSVGEVGIGTAVAVLGRALAAGNPAKPIDASPVAPYPPEGEAVSAEAAKCKYWPCHRQDLDMSDVCRLAALQTWTLKPAWPDRAPTFTA